jgi:hypothetical protein
MDKHNLQIPILTQESENILKLSNDFFTVTHDKNAGGVPVGITFTYGSKDNFLAKAISSHIALKKDGQVVFFRQCNLAAKVFTFESNKDGVKVFTSGCFADENGNTIPVFYNQTFFYKAYGRIDVSLELEIKETIHNVYEIGTCSFYVSERVNTLGVRPACSEPPPDNYLMSAESNLTWYNLTRYRSYTQQYNASYNLIPSYFALFEKGVEGLEFWREDCGKAWDSPFGNPIGNGIFLDDSKRLAPGLKYIRVEPFNSWVYPKSFAPGKETFRYTIGLPFVKSQNIARQTIFHLAITSRNWPTREEMQKLSSNGVKIIRLHDDNTFLKPSWPDCYYPPYDEENMKKMDEVIALAHEFNIKIVPYFSLKEFHPSCPEYPEKAHQWKRQVHSDGRIIAEAGPYGGYMCMKSNWLEFLKGTIKRVLNNHNFDGVYYDHLWFRYCRHPKHANNLYHTDAEEILDFLYWTRQTVGQDGIIFLHTSACPTMIGENLSDLIFIGEDMPYANPLPDTYPPDMDFVPITPRNWVPAGSHWNNNFKESTMIAALKHCPPGPHIKTNDFLLDVAAIFKEYDINNLEFKTRLAFNEDTENRVYVNVYSNSNLLLFFCANLSKESQSITLPADSFAKIMKVLQTKNCKISSHTLNYSNIKVEINPENIGIIQLAI